MKDKYNKQINEWYSNWFGISKLYADWAKEKGLTYYSLYTLEVIYENQKGCTQKMICDELFLPKQTVNSILADFEKKGYVFFEKDQTDKRNKLIKFTAKGLEFAEYVTGSLYEIEKRVMVGMDDEIIEQMLRGNDIFFQLLGKEMEKERGD